MAREAWEAEAQGTAHHIAPAMLFAVLRRVTRYKLHVEDCRLSHRHCNEAFSTTV